MSSAASSSAPLRIEQPDATYKSLAALLGSDTTSAASHLSLLSPQSLSSSFTHYLATLPTSDAAQFAQLVARSNALWQAQEKDATAGASKNDEKARSVSLLARSQLVFEATARSVLGRVHIINNQPIARLGLSSRRPLVSWVKAIIEAVTIDSASIPSATRPVPLPSFAILTGIVAGLNAVRSQKQNLQSRKLATRYALGKAEDEWCVAFSVCMQLLGGQLDASQAAETGTDGGAIDAWEAEFRKHATTGQIRESQMPLGADPYNELQSVTLYLAAQVSPHLPDEKIASLPAQRPILSLLSSAVFGLFEESKLMETLREDIRQSAEGMLTLSASSDTALATMRLRAHPLFTLLGPISRLLSVTLSDAIRRLSPLELREILLDPKENGIIARMYRIAQEWQAKWQSSRLSGAETGSIAEASREQTESLWFVFKTWLFSYTMVFDALMEAIVDVCPTPTESYPIPAETASSSKWTVETMSNIPEVNLETVHAILVTYSRMSWVTASFGSNAFDAYRRVFFEALEVISRDNRASVVLVEELLSDTIGVPTSAQPNMSRRAAQTFTLDVVEQLIGQLPDDLLEQAILPMCRPYLENRKYQDTFESAHSAVLSMFAAEKQFVLELTPYYVNLLLASFPTNLKAEQLTFAISTVVNAVSDRSDTVAWHTLESLWSEIEKERYRASAAAPSEPLIGGPSTAPATERESALCDVFVAQIANVNLVLLRSVLRRVKALILHTDPQSNTREHLCQQAYSALSGLDASTREEGVRWWLEERENFGM